MHFGRFDVRLDELHRNQLESFLFETLDDFADQATLHAIRFDHYERALVNRRNCVAHLVEQLCRSKRPRSRIEGE